MRITNSIMVNRMLYNLMRNMRALDRSNQQLSTGKKYVLPEEDPTSNVISMGYRTHLNEIYQYKRNIDDGTTWLNTAEQALNHANDLLQRIRTLTIQGANSHLDQTDRDAIAKEIDQLIKGLIDVGNTEFRGEYIFGGHETSSPPFEFFMGRDSGQSEDVLSKDWEGGFPDRKGVLGESITEVRYRGDTGEMRRQIQRSLYIAVNDPGCNIFSAQTHTVVSGTDRLRYPDRPLNDIDNFNGEINVSTGGVGTFSIGLDGGKMIPISYDANVHSLEDIRDMINNVDAGIRAEIKKIIDDNSNIFYRLSLESEIPGREMIITDDDQKDVKVSDPPVSGIITSNSFATAGFTTPPTGVVIINDVEFRLDDYASVDSFMNAVKSNKKAGIEDFYYDDVIGEFVIKAEDGGNLELEENGNPGFFTAANIKTRSDLMENLLIRNWIKGNLVVDKDTALQNIDGIKDGSITVNGKEIEVNIATDSLQDVIDKINRADVGVIAYAVETPKDSGSGVYTLMLRSEKPGEIEISDRDSDFFSRFGLIDKALGVKNNYPVDIKNPRNIKVFNAVIDIRNHLLNGDYNRLGNEDLKNLDDAIEQILEFRAKMGARVNTMETSKQKLEDVKTNTTNLLSSVEDVDIADTIMKLKLQENVHQAALASGSRIITQSLVDFLR